jgi:hypothetical protein
MVADQFCALLPPIQDPDLELYFLDQLWRKKLVQGEPTEWSEPVRWCTTGLNVSYVEMGTAGLGPFPPVSGNHDCQKAVVGCASQPATRSCGRQPKNSLYGEKAARKFKVW